MFDLPPERFAELLALGLVGSIIAGFVVNGILRLLFDSTYKDSDRLCPKDKSNDKKRPL